MRSRLGKMLSPIRRGQSRRRGITLIETTLTTIIVGLAVVALVKLTLAVTMQNYESNRMEIGMILANNVREMMAGIPFNDPSFGTTTFGRETGETALSQYNDLDDFDGFDSTVRSDLPGGSPIGVINAHRQVITATINGVTQVPEEWKGWRQQITVVPVDWNNLSVTQPKTNTARQALRITVVVSKALPGGTQWKTVATLSWVKAKV